MENFPYKLWVGGQRSSVTFAFQTRDFAVVNGTRPEDTNRSRKHISECEAGCAGL